MTSDWIALSSLDTLVRQQTIAYLQTREHELYDLIQNHTYDENLLFQSTDEGIRCRSESRPEKWIFGEKNLSQEIQTVNDAVSSSLPEQGLFILIGASIGYGIASLIPSLLNQPELRVIVVEPTIDRILANLTLVDTQSILMTERFHLIVSDLNEETIVMKLAPFHLYGITPLVVCCSAEFKNRIDTARLQELYGQYSKQFQEGQESRLTKIASWTGRNEKIKRVLIVNCWKGAPGGIHLNTIEKHLRQRGIQTRSLFLNRYRFDYGGLEYRRMAELKFLESIESFPPDLVLSYGYHAPQFVSESVFTSCRTRWIQVVTNVAYYDEFQYPGENTFVLDKHLIPIFQRRGYQNTYFVPLMADYVTDRPTETTREIPVVFIGNSLGFSPPAIQEFEALWTGRDALIRYIREAESVLGDFDQQRNLYDYLLNDPPPQVSSEREAHQIFRYLLCQGSAKRRQVILERLIPFGLVLFGGDWDLYLSEKSPLRSCWKGSLLAQDEPTAFQHGDIFVNIHSVGHVTGPNMRFFNVAGLGGFQVSDAPQFTSYLEADKETVFASSIQEFVEKVRYYLHHPDETQEIRRQAQERVKRDWTYRNWIDHVFQQIGVQ